MEMTDEETDEIMTNMIQLRKDNHNLIDEYYTKIRPQYGSRIAAQFYQLEYYFLNVIRISVLDNMQFIGE